MTDPLLHLQPEGKLSVSWLVLKENCSFSVRVATAKDSSSSFLFGDRPGDEQFISLCHLHKDRNHLWSLQRASVFYNHIQEMQRGRSM